MVFVKCVGCWTSLGKTGQWMKPERIAVSLRITGINTGLFKSAALLSVLALGSEPTPPS